jgi:hypothetical protein
MRIAVADARGQFGNPDEVKLPPLQAGSRALVKAQLTEKTQYVL